MSAPRPTNGWRAMAALGWLLPAVLVLGVLTALLVLAVLPALPPGWSRAVLRKGPETVARRCLEGWVVLLLPWLLRATGWRGWRDIGWRDDAAGARPGARWREALLGVGLGLLTLGGLALLVWWCGWTVASSLDPAKSVPGTLLGYAAAAAAVAVIEETVARGILFRLWARVWGWLAAALVSSALFGVVHFLGPVREAFDQPTAAATAWAALKSVFTAIPDAPHCGLRLLNLTLLGLVLCAMVWRTRTIWLAAGAHAGWVWCIKTANLLTDPAPDRPWSPWWGVRADLTDALASTVLMAGLLVLLLGGRRRCR